MDNTARIITLLLFIGIGIGSVMPEFGNLLAIRLGFLSHYFNKLFLVVGILGMCGFGWALFSR